MEPSAGVGIAADLAATFHLPRQLHVVLDAVVEVVGVDEVFAGVVRWVDVDELDFAGVALLQQLQHLQVVALDHQVLGGVPVHAVFGAGPQRAGAGGQRQLAGGALAVPVQAVLLVGVGHGGVAHQGLQHVHVDGWALGALGHQFREELAQLGQVVSHQVNALTCRRTGFDLFNGHGVSQFDEFLGSCPGQALGKAGGRSLAKVAWSRLTA